MGKKEFPRPETHPLSVRFPVIAPRYSHGTEGKMKRERERKKRDTKIRFFFRQGFLLQECNSLQKRLTVKSWFYNQPEFNSFSLWGRFILFSRASAVQFVFDVRRQSTRRRKGEGCAVPFQFNWIRGDRSVARTREPARSFIDCEGEERRARDTYGGVVILSYIVRLSGKVGS